MAILAYQALALWFLGYPDAALAATDQTIRDARETGDAATLMYGLIHASMVHSQCGLYSVVEAETAEEVALANGKGSPFWTAFGITAQGCLSGTTGKASDALQKITSGLVTLRATATAMWLPHYSSCLAKAYADLGQFDDAWRCIGDAATAIETNRETWFESRGSANCKEKSR